MGMFDKHNRKSVIYAETGPEVYTEMCDVCCRSWPAPIPRYKCVDKNGTVFVVRCCPYCDPNTALAKIGIGV